MTDYTIGSPDFMRGAQLHDKYRDIGGKLLREEAPYIQRLIIDAASSLPPKTMSVPQNAATQRARYLVLCDAYAPAWGEECTGG